MATPLIVAETVLASALVEDSVPVATPLASVGPAGCVRLLPVVGLAASTTLRFGMRFPNWSLAVTVISVAVPLPVLHPVLQAVIGVGAADTLDVAAFTAAGVMLKALLVSGVRPV